MRWGITERTVTKLVQRIVLENVTEPLVHVTNVMSDFMEKLVMKTVLQNVTTMFVTRPTEPVPNV